eukprot:7003966-Prymnesium_polylepis.1
MDQIDSAVSGDTIFSATEFAPSVGPAKPPHGPRTPSHALVADGRLSNGGLSNGAHNSSCAA